MAYVHFDREYAPCAFLIVQDDANPYDEEMTVLVQSDMDYPGVAARMGFEMPDHSEDDIGVLSSCFDHIAGHEGEAFPELDEYLEPYV